LDRITITAMMIIIAITMKIPNPIPALKIPAIALHDEKSNAIIRRLRAISTLEFFISVFLNYFIVKYDDQNKKANLPLPRGLPGKILHIPF